MCGGNVRTWVERRQVRLPRVEWTVRSAVVRPPIASHLSPAPPSHRPSREKKLSPSLPRQGPSHPTPEKREETLSQEGRDEKKRFGGRREGREETLWWDVAHAIATSVCRKMASAQAFLRGKSWHTQNRKNRSLKEEKEQEEERRKKKRKGLEKELQRGAEEMAQAKDARADLAFMYMPPPTTSGPAETEGEKSSRRGRDRANERTRSTEGQEVEHKKNWEGWDDPMREWTRGERSKPVGGGSLEAENQQLILDDNAPDGALDDIVSPETFQSLSRKEQRKLLRTYRKRAKALEVEECNKQNKGKAQKRSGQLDFLEEDVQNIHLKRKHTEGYHARVR